MSKFDPVDLIVLVLAVTVSAAIVVVFVEGVLHGVSDHETDNMTKILLSLATLISLYVGTKLGNQKPPADV